MMNSCKQNSFTVARSESIRASLLNLCLKEKPQQCYELFSLYAVYFCINCRAHVCLWLLVKCIFFMFSGFGRTDGESSSKQTESQPELSPCVNPGCFKTTKNAGTSGTG